MLQIVVPAIEYYDERNNKFVEMKEQTLHLEHSLISLSKWESKWNKPFLSRRDKTQEETLDYIRCMTLTQNVDPSVYSRLSSENISQISDYINAPMTATTFSDRRTGKASREIITAELVYYWMVNYNIPFECQKWHLNRLLTLIRVCTIKNSPPKKMSEAEVMRQQAELNEIRKAQLNTKG